MPRASYAIIESQVEHEVAPRVAPHFDQAEDTNQLIAILEDSRVRFYRFIVVTQELEEIQVDPKIDSHDRVLDVVSPASVDKLRGRIRDAVQMVLLVNSADMSKDTAQIVLDCIEEMQQFNGHVVAYGGGAILGSASRAWLQADDKYSVAGTRVYGYDDVRATKVFDDLDGIRTHFSEATGWRTTNDQPGPIEDFWEGVSQVLEARQMSQSWTQIMIRFDSWMEQSHSELFRKLTNWERGPSRREAHPNELFYERSKMIQDQLREHIIVTTRDIDRDFYNNLIVLARQRKGMEAAQMLLKRTLELLTTGNESAIFNEDLLRRLHALLEGEPITRIVPITKEPTDESATAATSDAVPSQQTERVRVIRLASQKPPRKKQASSHLGRIGRWAVAAALLAAPVATFHGFFGLNKRGVEEFASVLVNSVENHEPSNPLPFLAYRLSTEPSNPGKVASTPTTSCEIGNGLHKISTSSTPVYIFDANGELVQYPLCQE